MQRHSHRLKPRLAGLLVPLATAALLCPALAAAATAPAAGAAASDATTGGAAARAAAARVERYWTPARMRSARPLDLAVDGSGEARLRIGAPVASGASASFSPVSTPEVAPYSVNGRIFIRRGKLHGFCSGTAINSPTRQLVLTAGHCVNSGPEEGRHSVWSNFLEFVPAYTGGIAPFGAFVARPKTIRAPQQWVKQGNPDFDMGAFLATPNAEGVNLADAVGGGATIVTGLSRHQDFLTYGYPGETKRMQGCRSPYIGDDLLSNPFPGPPTMAIRCRWAPGASGGGWLIGDGTQINGINTYLHLDNRTRTYGPYFSAETVGKLVKGL
jgi:V8-like Glu-specific endopeptidase